MRAIYSIIRLVIVVFFCVSLTTAQGQLKSSDVTRMLIISDNQEHLLTGGPLKSFSPMAERLVTSVGLRSPLANVGGRLLMREAINFGKEQGAQFVLHLGDAVDISCENELEAVFNALDNDAPGGMWFMTPGNHDGLLAGNFAEYQDPVGFTRGRPAFYNQPPLKGYVNERNIWYYACQSPNSPTQPSSNQPPKPFSPDMPRQRVIELYVEYLKKRQNVNGQIVKVNSRPVRDAIFTEGGKKIEVPCRMEEIEIKPKQPSAIESYKAIARLCDARKVHTGSTWVGQYASFIAQKIDVVGTRIVLLDTSDYVNPAAKKFVKLPIAIFNGDLTKKQKKWAESLFKSDDGKPIDRRNVIVAGHHPFSQLPGDDRKWIAKKSGRYLSAHAHFASSLINHDDSKVLELNIGSTLDYPPQAVMAEVNSDFMMVRVAGAETNWNDFISKCEVMEDKSKWLLDDEFYKNYRSGLYITHLLRALREAADMHDTRIKHSSLSLKIPTGTKVEDWKRLEDALENINNAQGESRLFWACQAYYASKMTKGEKGFVAEWFAPKFGIGFKSGSHILSGWVRFSSP